MRRVGRCSRVQFLRGHREERTGLRAASLSALSPQPSALSPQPSALSPQPSSTLRIELIADPRLGDEVARVRRIRLELLAQLSHEHAQVFGLFLRRLAPDRLEQRPRARSRGSGAAPCRRTDRTPSASAGLRCRATCTRRASRSTRKSPASNDATSLVRARRGAPQRRAHARHQLVDAERLGHVVVGARVERLDLRPLLAFHRQHDDRHVRHARGCAGTARRRPCAACRDP